MTTFYIPIAGTHGSDDPWVVDNRSPFTRMMRANGFEPLRMADGSPIFNWPAKLAGLPLQGDRHWHEWAEKLLEALDRYDVSFDMLNLIAHSHGGQLAIILASRGFRLRTLTTVGTPRRQNLDAETAARYISFWQHIHDVDRDWIATLRRTPKRLGQIGDHAFDSERRFLIPGVHNCGVKDIDHSRVLNDPTLLDSDTTIWKANGWLENIRTAGGSLNSVH